MASASAAASGSVPGTVAAPFPLDSLCAPAPRARLTPTRSGYAMASSAPHSSAPSPSRKGNTGPAGSPEPTPFANAGNALRPSSSPASFLARPPSARRSCSATALASLVAARSTSPASYAEKGDTTPPPPLVAFFTAARAPPPAGRPRGAPRIFLLLLPLWTFVPMGTRVGAEGEAGAGAGDASPASSS